MSYSLIAVRRSQSAISGTPIQVTRSTSEGECVTNNFDPAYETVDPKGGRDGRYKCPSLKTDVAMQSEETAFPGQELEYYENMKH